MYYRIYVNMQTFRLDRRTPCQSQSLVNYERIFVCFLMSIALHEYVVTQIGVDEVVNAWYMDDIAEDEDRRLPHHRQPDEAVPLAKLFGTHSCK